MKTATSRLKHQNTYCNRVVDVMSIISSLVLVTNSGFKQQHHHHYLFTYAFSVSSSTTTRTTSFAKRRGRVILGTTKLYLSSISNTNSNNNNDNNEIIQTKSTFTIHDNFTNFLKDYNQQYDGYIIDQYGVMHNGINALDGSIECIKELVVQYNKKLIILSNTSAPSSIAFTKLPKFGFPTNYFIDIVTSGQQTIQFIQSKYSNTTTPKKCLFFTWDIQNGLVDNPRLTALPLSFIEQCNTGSAGTIISIAQSVDDADFILCHGSEVWLKEDTTQEQLLYSTTGDTTQVVDTILQQCIIKNLPLICANPDIIVLNPSSSTSEKTSISYMPGGIVQRYQELINESNKNNVINCYIFGKPYKEHFDVCIDKLNINDKTRICHIGDSLHHDILGANNAGIASILITSGIHSSELQPPESDTDTSSTSLQYGQLPSRESIQQLITKENNIIPTHVIPALRL